MIGSANCVSFWFILIYFSLIVKQAIFFAYVNHARIRSWNQPVLRASRVKFLAQGNNGGL